MRAKFTRIRIPGQKDFPGLMELGEVSVGNIVALARSYADHLRKELAAIDAALDADFQIDVVKGSIVKEHVKELQKSARASLTNQPEGK